MRTKSRRSPLALLSNPVCYRIVAAVGSRGEQTTESLAASMPDIPASTLYRRLAQLREARILRVVSERPARGAVERTYALAARDAAALRPGESERAPLKRVRATLRNFIAETTADAIAYIENPAFATSRNRFHAALYIAELTDREYLRVLADVSDAIKKARDRSRAGVGVKRHKFYLVARPEGPQ
ncbi:MAG: helix-turn-helix domain-containing protein [Candidatus Eremiobacteraeota bacterium]|nr:helix-turn-helix domain-containing protein [Candidatus Eremiobacteraeota bacterium]